MSFDSLLNKRCTIEKNTISQSSSGQVVNSWGVVASALRCRIDPKSGIRVVGPEVIYKKATHLVYMRVVPSITITSEDHRIKIDGVNYTVLWSATLDGKIAENHLEIVVEKVN